MPAFTLQSAHSSLIMNTEGAYLEECKSQARHILLPAQLIGEKLRGGLPVCAPIFGPGDIVGLPQHGFARNVEWTLLRQSENEAMLKFDAKSHAELPTVYQGCVMTYMIILRQSELALNLTIENRGKTAFICSPGFHPYFPTPDATSTPVRTDITRSWKEELLAATQFLPPHQEKAVIDLGYFQVTMTSSTLQQYAVWSAHPDKYICVEPTWNGDLADQSMLPQLRPGEKKDFDMTLRWRISRKD